MPSPKGCWRADRSAVVRYAFFSPGRSRRWARLATKHLQIVASLLAHYADYSDDPKPLVVIGILAIEIGSFAMAAVAFPGAIEICDGDRFDGW